MQKYIQDKYQILSGDGDGVGSAAASPAAAWYCLTSLHTFAYVCIFEYNFVTSCIFLTLLVYAL